MASAPEFVIDMLNGLLDAEANNVFRVIGRVSPALGHADPSIREPIDQLKHLAGRHAKELADLIVHRGGTPKVDRDDRPGDSNLPFLTLPFLLPKLVAEKDLILTRYENAKARIGPDYPDILEALDRIEGEQRQALDQLGRAAETVTGGRYTAPPHEKPRRPARGR